MQVCVSKMRGEAVDTITAKPKLTLDCLAVCGAV